MRAAQHLRHLTSHLPPHAVGRGAVLTTTTLILVAALLMAGFMMARHPGSPSQHLRPVAEAHRAAPSPTPTGPSRRDGIAAYFVFPRASVAANRTLLLSMNADAITFGPRLVPVAPGALPGQVRDLVGTRSAYSLEDPINWTPTATEKSDRSVVVDGVRWTVLSTTRDTAVVTKAGPDRMAALIRAGNELGAKTIVGLPRPRPAAKAAWLPDTAYLPTLSAFTTRFVTQMTSLGADGYYQSIEMPATDSHVYDGTRALYRTQHAAVAAVAPGSLVIISPYLESRRDRAHFTPAIAARGVRLLLKTARGTRVIIAPQDGLGVGSTALAADAAPGRVAPLETYLKAMRTAAGSRLWATVELMQPGSGNDRASTTRARVWQQISIERRYATGLIGFMWYDTSRHIGAVTVPGGVTTWSRGFGHTTG